VPTTLPFKALSQNGLLADLLLEVVFNGVISVSRLNKVRSAFSPSFIVLEPRLKIYLA
jgi:hypothetical protein